MKTHLLIALSALALVTAARAELSIADKATIETYTKDYLDCASLAAPVLDDGVSDAATVAAGVHSKCSEPFNLLTRGLSMDATNTLSTAYRQKVIQIILSNRAESRAKSQRRPVQTRPAM